MQKLIRSEYTGLYYSEHSWKKQTEKCKSKREFKNRKLANASRDGIKRNGSGRKLYAYRCPVCGKWHLTRNPKSDNGNTPDLATLLIDQILSKLFNLKD